MIEDLWASTAGSELRSFSMVRSDILADIVITYRPDADAPGTLHGSEKPG
jgi:hypothetical protein